MRICRDMVHVSDNFSLLRSNKLVDELMQLPDYEYFFSRWYLPSFKIHVQDAEGEMTTQFVNVIVIDAQREIKYGIGKNVDPKILESDGLQLIDTTAESLGLKDGDNMILNIDLNFILGDDFLDKTLAALSERYDEMDVIMYFGMWQEMYGNDTLTNIQLEYKLNGTVS